MLGIVRSSVRELQGRAGSPHFVGRDRELIARVACCSCRRLKREFRPGIEVGGSIDEVPNVKGSPGLFGNAIDAEIFYDNITVTKGK